MVSCEEVLESQRETWILFLAKRRNLTLPAAVVVNLSCLEPWSLDRVDQELEKISIDSSLLEEEQGGGLSTSAIPGAFLESFFKRHLKTALPLVSRLADQPSISLPLLGLLTWNLRQLSLYFLERKKGIRQMKLHPVAAEQMKAWSSNWEWSEILRLQAELSQLDYALKQSPLLPLGLWSDLVLRFCK